MAGCGNITRAQSRVERSRASLLGRFTGGNCSGLSLFDESSDLIRLRAFAKRTGNSLTEIDGLVSRGPQDWNFIHAGMSPVRRQSFWDSEQRHLREALARLVVDVRRLADDAASAGFGWSVV